MNGRTRKKMYDFLCKRDGEYCKMCGKLPWEGQLVIDHRDNDNSNNSPENLQLLCRSCNYIKNPRDEPLDMCVSSSNESIKINKSKEPKFREFVYTNIDENGSIDYEDAVYSGSEIVGVSPETAKRYIRKMCSKVGKLSKFRHIPIGCSLIHTRPILSLKYKEKDSFD
ncbi:MAG: HNH endonuclease [Candidatus Nitrosopumilus sp. bin_68KS]